MRPHVLIPVSEASQVGEVRRAAAEVARLAGLHENAAGKLAIIVTELAKNLVHYAQDGRILLQPLPQSQVQLLSVDNGPGFDLHRGLADGYSTGGTPGNGLGAVKRLASAFDAYSVPGQGTVLMVRVDNNPVPPSSFQAGSIVLPAPGEIVCGDSSGYQRHEHRAAFMIADGLGHGLQAADASDCALQLFDRDPFLESAAFIEASHRAMSGTRGAALAIAHLNFSSLRLSFAGVGNIAAYILTPTGRQGLASHNGIVGENLLRLKTFGYPIPLRGTLVMHSDGLQHRWTMEQYPGLLHVHPAVIAGVLYRDFCRGRDDLTVLVASWQGDAPVTDENAPQNNLSLEATVAGLREQVAAQSRQIDGLNAELAETNKGVVALYSELDQQADQLRHATELKSRFLSYMSHEFRTPLGSVISIARIMLSRLDGPLSPEQDKQVHFILDSSSELIQMVNDMLDLAKVEAGKISISPAWFDMVNLFSALRGMFKPLLTAESVPLIFEEPSNMPQIYSDDRKVAQILRNFISNALKFTEKGEIRVSAFLENNFIIFSVRDTGIGIARENQATLFNDYVQVDSQVQKRLRGIGLGLSLSRQFAELLGGRITVDSELGKGSTFSLHIPAHPASPIVEPTSEIQI